MQMEARERRARDSFNRRMIAGVGVPLTMAIAALASTTKTPPLEHVIDAWDTARPAITQTLSRALIDEPRMYPGDHAYFTAMADVYREGVGPADRETFTAMQDYLTRNPDFADSLPTGVLDVYLGGE